jgi:hypothetical protein
MRIHALLSVLEKIMIPESHPQGSVLRGVKPEENYAYNELKYFSSNC